MLMHVALVGPGSNPNPAHTVTDSQFEKILIELYIIITALPTHQWVTQILRPWTLSLPPTGTERCCPRLREGVHLPSRR